MDKVQFYDFVNKLIVPLFTGSYVAGETESSSRDLEVALGKGNSVLMKPTKTDEYRIILKRGQAFKSFEVNLIRAILEEMTTISSYHFDNAVYVQKLQSVAIHLYLFLTLIFRKLLLVLYPCWKSGQQGLMKEAMFRWEYLLISCSIMN